MGRLGGNLSKANKKKLMDEGQCFYCKEKGHRANRCPKKPRQQPSTSRPNLSHTHVTEVVDEENPKLHPDVCDLQMQLQAMTTEDKGDLLL